ncbi:MAG: TIGR03032 family protein [Bacteroidota bacterium]|nr:TIGR03032 family protein [Bacteroidota bacterium]
MNNRNPQSLAPFSCKYTPQIPQLLRQLNCSIAISTYQAGKVIFISAKNEDSLIQLPRNFEKAMGIAEDSQKDKIAIACKDEVIVFRNSQDLAAFYPNAPNKYDALYLPRNTFHTGAIDIHDLNFGNNGELYAVNTLFSSIVKIDDNYNFTPFWTPPFIDKIASEDRCHLNGMAMKNGIPKYATAFNNGNSPQSWREKVTESGIIIDVENNIIIAEGLGMPHTPRIFNDELYVLLSATGELVKININNGTYEVIIKIDGFVRGMSLYKDYLFIGLSQLRKNSSTFGKLPFAEKANEAGIVVVHLPTKSIIGKLTYLTSLDEIYDIHILGNKMRPNILNTLTDDHKKGLMIPKTTFWRQEKSE